MFFFGFCLQSQDKLIPEGFVDIQIEIPSVVVEIR
jgi:hypothetical protein